MFSWFLVVSQESFSGAVGKGCQRRSRGFVVLTYSMYAAGAKSPAALLDSLFQLPLSREGVMVLILYTVRMRCGMMGPNLFYRSPSRDLKDGGAFMVSRVY